VRELCGTCGSGLARHGGCGACGAVRTGVKTAPETDLLVAGVRCTFPCRACGFDSPLDELDGDGSAVCLKCGMHQTFPVDAWNAALGRLHALADLAGPDPEGSTRDPRWSIAPSGYQDIGDTQTVRTIEEGALTARATPGHPLCQQCGDPVRIVVEDEGMLKTSCASCGSTANYACQPSQFTAPIVGVIGQEHRTDQADATQQEGSFMCGGCGGPLPVDGLGRLVKCRFCQVVSRIPVQKLQGLKEPPPPDVWWLVFQGPSAERTRLLRGAPGEDGGGIEDPPVVRSSGVNIGLRVLGPTVALGIGGVIAVAVWAVAFTL